MIQMVLVSAGKDCFVIKVNKDKLFLLSHKGYVHGPLKSSPNIHQSKGIFEHMEVPQEVVKAVFS